MVSLGLIDNFKESIKFTLGEKRDESAKIIGKTFAEDLSLEPEIKKLLLDQSFRHYLTEELLCDSKEVKLEDCEALVTISILAARNGYCSAIVPINLLSDVFDCITLSRCEGLFGYVEANVGVWKDVAFFQSIRNSLLRLCNDLLRRLSRSQNTVFCGRILVFLAKFFPFNERSGLNIISEFNTSNVTAFNTEDQLTDMNGDMDVDHDGPSSPKKIKVENDENKFLIDYNLYSKFWQLQDYFRNPKQCYDKDSWSTFSTYSDYVFKTLQSFKIESVSHRNDLRLERDNQKDEERFFAKYLTNQNLLQLQLSDSNFRRYIYLQFLILFHYLQTSAKSKQDSALSEDQTRWVNTTRQTIFDLLRETPPDGEKFLETVQSLMKREEQWNAWKNDGCNPLIISNDHLVENGKDQKTFSTRKNKRKLGDVAREADRTGKFLMGNVTLTKLWNICPNNMDACASVERDFLPTVDEYFGEALEQLDPANQVEEAYRKVNDGSWGWRALRLLAKKTPHFFTHSNNPISKLQEYLESMLKRMEATGYFTNVKSASQGSNDSKEESSSSAIICTVGHLEKLAGNLSKKTNWNTLPVKLGVTTDELEKIFKEKNITEAKDKLLIMLQKWKEQEGSGATNEEIIYILEGLKMADAVEGVF